jgi:hypothetical protein
MLFRNFSSFDEMTELMYCRMETAEKTNSPLAKISFEN